MKPDTFLNAVGLIDERFLDIDTPSKTITHHRWTKRLAAFAAAAALVVGTLPTLTAFGVDPAYNILYELAPSVAQTFKPVRKTCSDKGIEMTVISAERKGSEASVCLAMHDTTGTYPEGEWDLYDSYRIHVPRDITGHCSFSEYDADTHTAYFVVHLETMDGSPMPDGKVTFSVREMLLGQREETGSSLADIDMSSIPYEPQTTELPVIISGYGYFPPKPNGQTELPCSKDYRFLIAQEQPLCTPAPYVSVMNIGYIDGALHILIRYEDNLHTDSHGHINLLDKNGNEIGDKTEIGFHYWDEQQIDSYTEQIIPVSYEMLNECSLKGEFMSSQRFTSGNWRVTFPLE
jgi:hypothetical protein